MPTFHGLTQLVLGSEPRQRARQQRSLMATFVCLVAIGVLAFGIGEGHVLPLAGRLLIGYLVAGLVLFYVALRSGWNQRAREPGLTLPQMGFAVTGMTAAYAVSGPARGGFLLLIACAMVFGGFTPKAAHARIACAATLVMLGLVMAAMTWIDPLRYPVRIEAVHFLLCALALPTIAAVGIELCVARERLKARNAELSAALVRLHLLASRDELTGLPNRRHVQDCLAREAARIRRRQGTACVCLIDLDRFKRLNDGHGHAAGDTVLKEFAAIALGLARRCDVLGRWGGEEFLWLLPDTSVADAHHAIDRLHTAFAGSATWRRRPELRTTFSAGLAEMDPGDDLARTLERADAALYAAKREGRNRTVYRPRAAAEPGAMLME